MWSLVFVTCNLLLTMAVQSFDLRDFDLPGIFSSEICSSDSLRQTVLPICSCKEQSPFNDLQSLCRVHIKLGECIESKVAKEDAGDFLHHTFGKGRLRQNLDHLCHNRQDADAIVDCSSPAVVTKCNGIFNNGLAENFTEEKACRLSEDVGECLWNETASCSPTTRYFWWKLADAHIARRCTKYGKSRTDKCDEIRDIFHPHQSKLEKECKEEYHTLKQCYILERLDSVHHKDIYQTMEFQIENFEKYSRIACELLEKRMAESACEKSQHRKIVTCHQSYTYEAKVQMDMLLHNRNITVDDICRIYTNLTGCFRDALKDCPNSREHWSAWICSMMPSTCNCPLELQTGGSRYSRSSAAVTSASTACIYLSFAFFSMGKWWMTLK